MPPSAPASPLRAVSPVPSSSRESASPVTKTASIDRVKNKLRARTQSASSFKYKPPSKTRIQSKKTAKRPAAKKPRSKAAMNLPTGKQRKVKYAVDDLVRVLFDGEFYMGTILSMDSVHCKVIFVGGGDFDADGIGGDYLVDAPWDWYEHKLVYRI